jgi:hypothetical protein
VKSRHHIPRGIAEPDTEHGDFFLEQYLDHFRYVVRTCYRAGERWSQVEASAKAVEDGLHRVHHGVRKPRSVDRRPDLRVKQEIHAERLVGQLADASNARSHFIRRRVGRGENSETSGSGNCGGELGTGDRRHACLQYRVLDTEQVAQLGAKPERLGELRWLRSSRASQSRGS